MSTAQESRPTKYNFVLNPYPDNRISRCPFCENKTGQRKLPLLIHIEPLQMVSLNYTCRYCKECDLLIAHKHEVEFLLTQMFRQRDPSIIGNEYLILGTLEKSAWKEGMKEPKTVTEMQGAMSYFKSYYEELRHTRKGWYPEGVEPPIAEPPPSKDWVKSKTKTATVRLQRHTSPKRKRRR